MFECYSVLVFQLFFSSNTIPLRDCLNLGPADERDEISKTPKDRARPARLPVPPLRRVGLTYKLAAR